MDRQFCEPIYSSLKPNIEQGFCEIIKNKKNCIVTTGFFTSKVKQLIQENNINCSLIDFFEIKNYDIKNFVKTIKKYKKIITIEEHSLRFGIGSIISTIISDNNLNIKLSRMGLIEGKTFNYGTRNMLFNDNKLDNKSIKKLFIKTLAYRKKDLRMTFTYKQRKINLKKLCQNKFKNDNGFNFNWYNKKIIFHIYKLLAKFFTIMYNWIFKKN